MLQLLSLQCSIEWEWADDSWGDLISLLDSDNLKSLQSLAFRCIGGFHEEWIEHCRQALANLNSRITVLVDIRGRTPRATRLF